MKADTPFTRQKTLLKGTVLLCLGAVCISFAPLFVKFVDAGPGTVAVYRMLWGGLLLFGLGLFKEKQVLPGRSTALAMLLTAIFFSLDIFFWHVSITYLGPGLATILVNFQVFFMAAFGILVFKEKVGARFFIALPLAFLGLALLLGLDVRQISRDTWLGIILGISGGFFYACYLLGLRNTQTRPGSLPTLTNMGLITLVTAVLMALLALSAGESLAVSGTRNHLLLLLYGVGCQGIGWLLISSGLPHVPASRAGLLILVQPALSFIWDIVLLGRTTSALGYLGAALALFAVCFGQSGARKK